MKDPTLETSLESAASQLGKLSRSIDTIIEMVRHHESIRNMPECRALESEICAIINMTETTAKLNAVWKKLDKLA